VRRVVAPPAGTQDELDPWRKNVGEYIGDAGAGRGSSWRVAPTSSSWPTTDSRASVSGRGPPPDLKRSDAKRG
jgi:hypothetical protein